MKPKVKAKEATMTERLKKCAYRWFTRSGKPICGNNDEPELYDDICDDDKHKTCTYRVLEEGV